MEKMLLIMGEMFLSVSQCLWLSLPLLSNSHKTNTQTACMGMQAEFYPHTEKNRQKHLKSAKSVS